MAEGERGALQVEVEPSEADLAAVRDPFSVLGVDRWATNAQVESAFRKASLVVHPDRKPGDPEAGAKFWRLTRAKDAMLDPVMRAEAVLWIERKEANQRVEDRRRRREEAAAVLQEEKDHGWMTKEPEEPNPDESQGEHRRMQFPAQQTPMGPESQ